MTSIIPKRIIQIWGGGKKPPLFAQASAASVKLNNPGYEYLIFDDEAMLAFIDQHCPEMMSTFQSFELPIQRYDFFRYLAVFHLGGFYFDMDIFLARGLSDLLGFSCVFPFEMLTVSRFLQEEHDMDWQVGNYGFGAAPQHPFLGSLIENCARSQRDKNWTNAMLRRVPRFLRNQFSVVYVTGPGLVSRTLAEYPTPNDITILFPKDVCNPDTWSTFGDYGVHLMIGAWRKKPGALVKRLQSAWLIREQRLVLERARRRGGARPLEFRRAEAHDRVGARS